MKFKSYKKSWQPIILFLSLFFLDCPNKISPKLIGFIPISNNQITAITPTRVKGSFQSGNVSLFALSTASRNITLTTVVDSTKAFVLCNAKNTSSNIINVITCQLNTEGTEITIQTGGGFGAIVDWYVMEFSLGATVQRGATSFTSTDTILNTTLSTFVTTSKAFVISYSQSTVVGTTIDGYRTVRASLSSSTNLEFARNQAGGNATVEWQVVQFDGASVKSGLVTLSDTNTSTTVALSSSVNLNSSFIIMNYKIATAIGGVERDYYTTGSFVNSSTLSFSRVGNTGDVDISWFAVEMLDGTTVQSGTASMVAGNGTTTSSTLSIPVTTEKSMIVFSNDTSTNPPSIPDDAGQDSGTYTSTFNSSTQVNFKRYNDETNGATINWFIVSFQ